MEMRGAVAGAFTARVTAEGDRLPLYVAAIGVTAISLLQFKER
jgi:hypothetical protein